MAGARALGGPGLTACSTSPQTTPRLLAAVVEGKTCPAVLNLEDERADEGRLIVPALFYPSDAFVRFLFGSNAVMSSWDIGILHLAAQGRMSDQLTLIPFWYDPRCRPQPMPLPGGRVN